MRTPEQKTIKLKELLNEQLVIPRYQRPYKWTEKNVVQLLDDIFEYVIVKKKEYRIGNIILHEDDKVIKNVVDGQQRLTTISLLLRILDSNFGAFNFVFKHKISKNNIVYNSRVIDNWLSTNGVERTYFKQQILDKCEFVLFTVYQSDEAFQLFDSQNARGKELEPYDLLKAFHLREMENDTEDERTKCVERWERSIEENKLKPILGNHLFKIRKWAKNESKYDFTKSDIDEFKGVSLHHPQKYPYENALRMLDGFVDNAQNDKFLKNLHIAQTYPFSITMPIINGKRFFEYVDYYIQQKDKIFEKDKKTDFLVFYGKYCTDYPGAGRSGDEKVRNLYENILMSFFDKFGFVENFYQTFYKAAYIIRCVKKNIRKESILQSDAKQIIRKIDEALTPDSLKNYQSYVIDVTDFVKHIEHIKQFIENGK